MKKVFKTDEVAHIWASQQQNEGRNSQGNLFFEGDKIYSYGRHFCIAKLLPSGIVLFTDRGYSNTTAKHKHLVSYAVNHKTKVYCANPDEGTSGNLPHFTREFKGLINIINDPKRRQKTKDIAKQDLLKVAKKVDLYLDTIGVPLSECYDSEFMAYYNTAKSQDIEALNKEIEKREAEAKERARLAQIEAEKKAKKDLSLWKKGKQIRLPYSIDTVYLRNIEDTVETSKGAVVSVKAAKILFDLIKEGKDIKGFDIDGYTVVGLNGVLTIGCHKIERKEINRFAKVMGWGTISSH